MLSGTTIGAGVFALPYVFSRSGWLPSLIGLLFLGVMISLLNVFYARITIKTDGDHQLVGYVKKYLGKKWSWLAMTAFILSMNGVLIAYVVLGGEFLSLALGQLPSFLYSVWFYLIGAFLVSRNFKIINKISFWLTAVLIALMVILPLGLTKFVQFSRLPVNTSTPLFFWGAALFSLAGFTIIPEVEEVLRDNPKQIVKAVVFGSWIPVIFYLPFVFSIWGTCGSATTADAFSCLIAYSPTLVRIGAVFGLVALLTSFISLANALKEVYFRDLVIGEVKSKILAVVPAFFAVFLSTTRFIDLVSFTGAVSLTISAVMICMIYAKVFRKNRWLAWIIGVIFVLGAGAEILS